MNQNTKPNKLDTRSKKISHKLSSASNFIKNNHIDNYTPNKYQEIDEEFDREFNGELWLGEYWEETDSRKDLKYFIHKQLDKNNREWEKVVKKHRPVFFKNDDKSLLTMDEVLAIREVVRIEILEEMGIDCSKMRKQLKLKHKEIK